MQKKEKFFRFPIFRLLVGCFVMFVVAGMGQFAPARAAEPPVRVFAAISLSESLTQAAKEFESRTDIPIQLNLGASGQLCAQIEQGAPADIFISADHKQVKPLIDAGMIQPDDLLVIARNRLVLICPIETKLPAGEFQVLSDPQVTRVAIGEPKSVPAGEYALQVLKNLQLMTSVQDKLVYAANVRQVLDYVERGEVDAGIVYQSDAKTSNRVRVIAVAATKWHHPIEYPAAVLKTSPHPVAAEQFIHWLAGSQGQQILRAHGFSELEPTSRPGGR